MNQIRGQPEMSSLLALAKEILVASEEQEWERVSDLVKNWNEALRDFFTDDSHPKDIKYTENKLHQLNEINSRVIALVEDYRNSLSVQLEVLRRGRKAVSAYNESHTRWQPVN